MKKTLSAFLAIALTLCSVSRAADAAYDMLLTQRKDDNSGNIQRNVAPTANYLLGWDASKHPIAVAPSSGGVTSVAASVPAFLSISGSPVTTTGTLAITYSGTALPAANGGTGLTSLGSLVPTWLGTPTWANFLAAITGATPFASTTTSDALQASRLVTLTSSSTDTFAGTAGVTATAYTTGTHYIFIANTANTGAASLNINGLGAKTIVKVAGGVTTTLADNDIRVNQVVIVGYDGTNFQIQSLLGNAPSGSGTVTTSGSPAATYVPFFSSATAITGESNFSWTQSGSDRNLYLGGAFLSAGLQATSASQYSSLYLYNDGGVTNRIEFGFTGSSYTGPPIGSGLTGVSAFIKTYGAHSIQFGTNNTYRGMIHSSGRLIWGSLTDAGSTYAVQVTGSLLSDVLYAGGTTQGAQIYASSALGEMGAGTFMSSFTAHDLNLYPTGLGTNGQRLSIGYHRGGGTWSTAFEIANTTGGAAGVVKLLKSGGHVLIGTSTDTGSNLLQVNGASLMNQLYVGTLATAAQQLQMYYDAATLGEMPSGMTFSSNAVDLNIFAAGAGTSGKKLSLGYYNGSAWKEAFRVAHTTGGANGVVYLGEGGTTRVVVGTTTDDGSNLLQVAGSATASGSVTAGNISRVTSSTPSFPAAGKGVELFYATAADKGTVLSYDRGGSAYKPLELDSSALRFALSGSLVYTIDSSGVAISNTLLFPTILRATSHAPSFPAAGKGVEIFYTASTDKGSVISYDRGGSAYKPLELDASVITFATAGVLAFTSNATAASFAQTTDASNSTTAALKTAGGFAAAKKVYVGTQLNVGTSVAPDSGGIKHSRTTTGSVSAGSTALVTITWGTAFADANYTVTADVLDSTTSSLSLSVVHVESVTASAVTVRVLNNSVGSLTGTVQVIAMHD